MPRPRQAYVGQDYVGQPVVGRRAMVGGLGGVQGQRREHVGPGEGFALPAGGRGAVTPPPPVSTTDVCPGARRFLPTVGRVFSTI